ncbi:MAG: TetR/AcrR family transcriptional regulator [Rhizobacter sp.]
MATRSPRAAPAPAPKPRLSAQARRAQIMDSATELILGRGLAQCTLDEVAVAAGISKALIYRHFSSRDELLKALLEREFSVLRGRGLGAFAPDAPFERVVRLSTQQAFDYLYERGAILRELFSDRSAVALLQSRDRDERMASTRFFVDKSIQTYAVPPEVAQIIAVITINAPASAARGLRRFGFSPELSADAWSEFVLGGWAAVAKRFGNARKPGSLPPHDKTVSKKTATTPSKPAGPGARKRSAPRR